MFLVVEPFKGTILEGPGRHGIQPTSQLTRVQKFLLGDAEGIFEGMLGVMGQNYESVSRPQAQPHSKGSCSSTDTTMSGISPRSFSIFFI